MACPPLSSGQGNAQPEVAPREAVAQMPLAEQLTASWCRSCRCGDELVEVNDSPVHCMTLNDVYAVLSHCSPGPVPIIVSRHPDPQVTALGRPLPPGLLFHSWSKAGRRQMLPARLQPVPSFYGKERWQPGALSELLDVGGDWHSFSEAPALSCKL